MAKYIDANVLKAAIKELDSGGDYTVYHFLEIIDKMPAADVEQVRKWILCSEQMPEMDEDVLTCDENGFIAISSCNGGGEFTSYEDDYYIGYGKKPKVVAWTPLPEPPKMDGGSE